MLHGKVLRSASATIWYVDSGVSDTEGTSWGTAVGTLNAAVDLASGDDWILLGPGHNESLTGADGVDLDKSGLTVEGFGRGSKTPTFTYDAGIGEFVIGADDITIRNLRFVVSSHTSDRSVGKAIDIEDNADYATIDRCEFGFAETLKTDYWQYTVIINAVTGTTISNCFFDSGETAADAAIVTGDSDLTTIKDNTIIGDYSSACIYSATDTSNRTFIERNLLWNGIHDSIGAIAAVSLLSTDSGIIRDNDAFCNVATVALVFVGDNMVKFNNSYNEDIGGAATNWPVVASNTSPSVTPSGDN